MTGGDLMIEASGRVTALDDDYALVSIVGNGCGRCHEEGGCGGQNLGQMFCSSPKVYRVPNPRNACIGDTVVVVIGEKALFRGALVAYGLPLAGLFVGAAMGLLSFGDTGSIVGGLCGLCLGWGLLRIPGVRNMSVNSESRPRIK